MSKRRSCPAPNLALFKVQLTLSVILLSLTGCVGDIEQKGGGTPEDMAMPDLVQAGSDMDSVDDLGTTPLPMKGLAMTYSSFYEEAALQGGRSIVLEPGEALRGVVDLSHYAVVIATDKGLYSWQEDGTRRELVKGDIKALVKYDEQSALYLQGGEVYRFDGGQPEVVLGGLEGVDSELDPVMSLFRSGRDLWFFSEQSTWSMSQDPLAGTHFARFDGFDPRPDALWGTLNASTYYYHSAQEPDALFKVERATTDGALTIERVMGEGMDLVEAIYPLRGHRHLAVIQGLLAEQIDGVWWWRHPELDGGVDRAKVEVLAHAHDPLASATWLLARAEDAEDPQAVTLYRIESSWAIRATLPQSSAEEILGAVATGELVLHPQSTPNTIFFSITGASTKLIELRHEKFTKPALLDPPRGEVTYEEHVRPVAEIFCQECHTNGQGAAIFKINGYEAWSNPTQFDIFLGSIERGSMPKRDEAVPPFSDELRSSFVESLKQWREGGFKP